jgi:transcriptional regulator with XRE-family HTH domain
VTLKDWMKREGRSNEWLAEKLRVSPVTISRYRTGKHKPSGPAKALIAELSGNAVTEWSKGDE